MKDRQKAKGAVPVELELILPARVSAVEAACTRIREVLARCHLQNLRFAVEILARECLNNAIQHGSAGRPAARVSFVMRVKPRHVCLRISDQGPGFAWRHAWKRQWPSSNRPGGRGLMVIRTYAHRIAFNARGNAITLWIHRTEKGRQRNYVDLQR